MNDQHKVTRCNFKQFDVRPEPCGKLTPDLTGSRHVNSVDTPEDWLIKCPECDSDNVVSLDGMFNPGLEHVRGTWFCLSCQEGWTYVRDESTPTEPPGEVKSWYYMAEEQKRAISNHVCIWCQKTVDVRSLDDDVLHTYMNSGACGDCQQIGRNNEG